MLTPSSTSNHAKNSEIQFSVWPNPFTDEAVLSTNFRLNNAEMVWLNNFGQKVKDQKNISGHYVPILSTGLAKGTSNIQTLQQDKILHATKVVIQ